MSLERLIEVEALKAPRLMLYLSTALTIAVIVAAYLVIEGSRESIILLVLIPPILIIDLVVIRVLLTEQVRIFSRELASILRDLKVLSVRVKPCLNGVIVAAVLENGQLHIRAGPRMVEAAYIRSPLVVSRGKRGPLRICSCGRRRRLLLSGCGGGSCSGLLEIVSLDPVGGTRSLLRGEGRCVYRVCTHPLSGEELRSYIEAVIP